MYKALIHVCVTLCLKRRPLKRYDVYDEARIHILVVNVKSKTSLNAILSFSVALIFVVIRVVSDNMSTGDSVEPMDVSINLKNPFKLKHIKMVGGRVSVRSLQILFTMFLFFIPQTLAIRGANNISRGEHFMSLYPSSLCLSICGNKLVLFRFPVHFRDEVDHFNMAACS